MEYKEKISELVKLVPRTLVNFEEKRIHGRAPTQAFSEFLTNREQGNWAEELITKAINSLSINYCAIKYGKSECIVAGEEGFDEFYKKYQDELDAIGKRPDILIFPKNVYKNEWGKDISNFSNDVLKDIVPLAVAGLEVRSSSFLIDKYDEEMHKKNQEHLLKIRTYRDEILTKYKDLFLDENKRKYLTLLEELDEDHISIIKFKLSSWRSSEELIYVSKLLKEIKKSLKEIQKRDFLSITPKVEDLKIVYKWVETYNVPHYYFQVFFDKVYGISFRQILELLSDKSKEGVVYHFENGDSKNQNKATIKINSKIGAEIAHKVDMPEHYSQMKQLGRGRLLFHVSFRGGEAYLNVKNFFDLLEIKPEKF